MITILCFIYMCSIPVSLAILVNCRKYEHISGATPWILGFFPILNTLFVLHHLRCVTIPIKKTIEEIKEIFSNEQKQETSDL